MRYLKPGKLYRTNSDRLSVSRGRGYFRDFTDFLNKDVVFMALNEENKILVGDRILYVLWPEDIPDETEKIET